LRDSSRNLASVQRASFLQGIVAASAAPQIALASLTDKLAEIERASTGTLGVYARRLGSDDADFTYNADVQFPSASIIKLVILVALARSVDNDPDTLQRNVTLRGADLVGGSETLAHAHPGERYRIDTLARAMIAQSDNSASNTLITYLGFQRINQTAAEAGLTKTHLGRHFSDNPPVWRISQNITSPRDMGELLYTIEDGKRSRNETIASPEMCDYMVGLLLQQEDHDKIAAGLPPGTQIANKTGEVSGVRSDVAIVTPNGPAPYVLAVLTKGLGYEGRGVLAIREVARAVNAAIR